MNSITGLLQTRMHHDSIWLIVDRMTKSTLFLPVNMPIRQRINAKLYIQEVVRLHVVPIPIIAYKGAQFTAQFWKSFQKVCVQR